MPAAGKKKLKKANSSAIMLKGRVVAMKKKIEKEYKKIQKKVKKFWGNFRKNPRLTCLSILNVIVEVIKNNMLFSVFVLINVFIAILLRFFTIHTTENLLLLKPVLADLAIVLFLGGVNFVLKEKNRFPYLLMISTIFSIICIANSIYYTFYTSFISVSLIATSRYAVQVGDAIVKNVLQVKDFIYLISPILLIITHIRIKNGKKSTSQGKRDIKKMISTFIAAGITLFFFIISLTSLDFGRFANQWNREYILMRFGVYAYQLNDIVKSIEPQLTSLFGYDEALKTFNEYYANVPSEQEKKNQYTGIFEGKNILVIHYESMQNLNIGLTFNGQEVTPTLNKLVKDSIYFSNFYSQVSNGTSSDSEFTFNTSLMPTNTGTVFVSYFNREYVTTPLLLREKGYYTFSMHANNGSYWNRDTMHETLGYQRFFSKRDYDIDEPIGLGLSDKSFYRQSIEKIKEINAKGQPYYGTIITLTNHTPFADTDKYGEFDVSLKTTKYNEETGMDEEIVYPYLENTKLGNYFKSVHYADEALGEFIDALEREGILDNTVLVIYGDHDARLPKTDYRKLYNYDPETDSSRSCEEGDTTCVRIDANTYELLRKVPLLIYSKETKEKLHQEVTTVMGMYDVMPTLGNMFGFYNPYQLGHDIFNITDDNIVVFPNGNWVTNKIYYNAQNGSILPLKETEIKSDYIDNATTYSENLLKASSSTIIFDLIKRTREREESGSDYIEEKAVIED